MWAQYNKNCGDVASVAEQISMLEIPAELFADLVVVVRARQCAKSGMEQPFGSEPMLKAEGPMPL